MKRSIALLVLAGIATSAFAGGAGETATGEDTSLDYIMDKGELVLGLDDSFPPMGFRDDDGEIVGFDIDLAREVTDRMGVELRLQPIDWDSKTLDLNSRDIDVIWNGMTITPEREEQVTFSKPYIANRQIVIVQADSDIDTLADLDGATVGLQLGSSAQDAVESEPEVRESFAEMSRYQDNVQALLDLEVGRIDAVVVDEILGRYYISQRPESFDVASEYFTEEQYGIGFRKGEEAFAERVDEILDEMVEDGTAAEISQKWFDEDVLLPR
ncbi:MAG: amino acid ABC transporter substrate-binding protein [Alkalispirochaeta sp.]